MTGRRFLACLILVSLSACKMKTDSDRETDGVLVDSLTMELNNQFKKGLIKGFGVAIVNADTTLYSKGFGFSNVDARTPYTKHTLQNIASVSKTLIGVALLKAQEMGSLRLDDPINNYLPFEVANPLYPDETITLRHLATHTSSIQDGDLYGAKSYILRDSSDLDRAKRLPSSKEFLPPGAAMDMGTFLQNFLAKEGPWFSNTNYLEKRPGEHYEYTNVGATLAAYIIERATGHSYAEFTARYLMNPLEMSASGWDFAEIDQTKLTHLYTVEGEKIPDYRLITYPDGGLITSVHDKAKYLSELIRGHAGKGTLLPKASYQQLFSEFLTEGNFEEERDTDRPFDDEYNTGLFIGHTPAGYIGHMGGDPGVSTFMFFDPNTQIGKLLFVNTDLDQDGADQFYAIWAVLGKYEERLNTLYRR